MTIGFGIIGCGMISNFHARAIADAAGAKLIGVADRIPEPATKFAEDHGCIAYETVPRNAGRSSNSSRLGLHS